VKPTFYIILFKVTNNNAVSMDQVADLLQDPSLSVPSPPKEQNNVTVVVSGSRFCIVPSLYKKVEKLPWQNHQGVPQLSATNPDVFEMMLQYFLFGSLPDGAEFAELGGVDKATQLKELAEPLDGTDALIEHVKFACLARKEKRKSSSFFRKNLPIFTATTRSKKQRTEANKTFPIQETVVYPFAASKYNSTIGVDYLPSLEASDSTDSEESSLRLSASMADDATSVKSTSKEQGKKILLKKSLRSVFQNSSSKKAPRMGRKMTHEEWCSTEYVL
jgi:hypothetical protein